MSEPLAWFKMLRISNSPTIISNVMVGLALAIHSHTAEWGNTLTPPRLDFLKPLIVVSFALLLVYFSGMIFNDAIDAKWDKKHRPDRPIPSGLIKRRDAWLTASFMLGCGVLLSGMNQTSMFFALLLAGAVIGYTFLHKWLVPAMAFMSMSRVLVFVVAMTALKQPPPIGHLLGFCIAIGIYTALLTFVGRQEHKDESTHAWLVWLMVLPPIIPIVMYGELHEFGWIMLVVYFAWMLLSWREFRPSTNQPISGMHKLLAGFCLLDCVLIASLGELSIMIVSLICFVFTVVSHRRIMGT